jgi:UDP-2,3-diacylglucosamine pyrophosphatase LpxH
MISNLHIIHPQRVVVFLIAENLRFSDFYGTTGQYTPCLIPFYGKYDDYGGVEECEGPALDLILDKLRDQLFEMDVGKNKSHDIEVKKKGFNIDLLFQADHEGRLGIVDLESPRWTAREKYDVLMEKIGKKRPTSEQQARLDELLNIMKKPEPMMRKVKHVVIHGDIFDKIINEFYIEDYVGENKGTHGWQNSYTRTYFKDIVAEIDDTVEFIMQQYLLDNRLFGHTRFRRPFDTEIDNRVLKWLQAFDGHRTDTAIVQLGDTVIELAEKEKWKEIKSLIHEALVGIWINRYMTDVRKSWAPTIGLGSQQAETHGYELLINAMSEIIKKEKEEYEDDDE